MKPKSILVLGGSDTGKTHFGAQLILRLEARGSAVRYFEPPTNIQAFEEARTCLNQGRSADHTAGKAEKEIVLPLEFPGGDQARVVWPEYGGEQLTQLVARRRAGATWTERARQSDAWLLFVRHEHFKEGRDLLNRPVSNWTDCRRNASDAVDWMPQARIIEMLQMLLFLRRASRRNPLVLPRMGVVLTCWDTFPEQSKFERPVDAFHSLAPLMADFIESSWDDSSVFVIALSALGRSLDKVRQDEEFMDTGPTSHGWLIKPDGENTQDLTFPIVRITA